MLDLTIAIPVKNEAVNIAGCIESIGTDLAKNIVLIDSGSTDDTCDIALSMGAEVLQFDWDGKFPKKRNWFLRNHTPNSEWVLFLDADEYLTDDFKTELTNNLKNSGNKDGFWLSYTIYFLGKKLKGGYPLNKLALFKVGAGEYERIDEDQWSNMDMEIHEHPVLEGEIGTIKCKIDHRDFRGVGAYMSKHNEYAAWEAARYSKWSSQPEMKEQWTWKQRLKYRFIRTAWIGPIFFFGSFILMGGFRDGMRGLAFAILKMSYFTQIYCRLQEQKDKPKSI